MSKIHRQIEKIRAQSPAFKQRVVFLSALVLTVILVGGMYGVQGLVRANATRNTELAEQGIEQPSPFSIISETWQDMIRYVEQVGQDIIPDRNIFQKNNSEADDAMPVRYPGVELQPVEEQ